MTAEWSTDAGQRIGPAYEVEGGSPSGGTPSGVAPPPPVLLP